MVTQRRRNSCTVARIESPSACLAPNRARFPSPEAVPADPVEELYLELRDAGVAVERVGDCVAPRRAHAAVIEGERAGARI